MDISKVYNVKKLSYSDLNSLWVYHGERCRYYEQMMDVIKIDCPLFYYCTANKVFHEGVVNFLSAAMEEFNSGRIEKS